MKNKITKKQYEEAKEYLTNNISEGDTIYTHVEHVSASGMSRDIKVMIVRGKKIVDVSFYVSQLI